MVDLPDPEPPAIPMSSCGTVMVRAVFKALGGGQSFLGGGCGCGVSVLHCRAEW